MNRPGSSDNHNPTCRSLPIPETCPNWTSNLKRETQMLGPSPSLRHNFDFTQNPKCLSHPQQAILKITSSLKIFVFSHLSYQLDHREWNHQHAAVSGTGGQMNKDMHIWRHELLSSPHLTLQCVRSEAAPPLSSAPGLRDGGILWWGPEERRTEKRRGGGCSLRSRHQDNWLYGSPAGSMTESPAKRPHILLSYKGWCLSLKLRTEN